MKTIFREAFTKHTINRSRLMRYADRREKKEELGGFVKTILKFLES